MHLGLADRPLGRQAPRQPAQALYTNLVEVKTNGIGEVTFILQRPQPAFIALLASGMSPVYPCHVPPAQMRQHPIGTGPFKFVEFKPNESIKLVKNPDYWKPGLPYLDGIEYTVSRNRSTIILSFIAGQYDLTFAGSVSVPLMHDIEDQKKDATCILPGGSVSTNLMVNREKPPFDNAELRRAMALTLDRKSFIDILTQGTGQMAAAMQPPQDNAQGGLWGLPKELLGAAGLRSRCRQEPRRGAGDHAETRLRLRSPAHVTIDAR